MLQQLKRQIRSLPVWHELKVLTQDECQMFRDFEKAENRYDDYSYKSFPYIRLYENAFLRSVLPHLKPKMRVVDVGCGAGDKLVIFHKLHKSLRITGIEHNPVMAKVARYVAPYSNIIEGDAFAQDYSQYDLIYMYWPIAYSPRQCDLQWLCMQTMKRGAVLVVAGAQDSRDYPMFPNLMDGWVKP